MLQDRFALLVTKKMLGDLTTAETQELDVMLQQADHAAQYRALQRFWNQQEKDAKPDVEKALQKVWSQITPEAQYAPKEEQATKVVPFWKKPLAAVLALLLTVLAIAIYLATTNKTEFAKTNPKNNDNNELPANGEIEKQNAKGTRSLITLADGSKVWLNADSKLQYPNTFKGNTREVTLVGEAFFDIAKNKQKPFIIHLQAGTVRVLGTSFNIKAYEGSKWVETSVLTGKVAFIPAVSKNNQNTDTTFLTPNMKAVYEPGSGELKTASTIGEEDKAWTEGKMIFRSMKLEEIGKSLERNFGKEVVFNNDELMNYTLTGSFENNTLEEILYYLSRTKPFTYRITETQIVISSLEQ
jgi:transmembrane sensor